MKQEVKFPRRSQCPARCEWSFAGVTYRSGWWPPRSCTWGAGSPSGTGCRQCAPGRSSGSLMTSKGDLSQHRSRDCLGSSYSSAGDERPPVLPVAAPLSLPGTAPEFTRETPINTHRIQSRIWEIIHIAIESAQEQPAATCNCKKHQNCQCKA